uniref:Saposin B-type domain-containing protein n=1 Tax=Chromera velia CCMP2878 TaxID=1169474 RepID=A0A0G4G9V2_9ALVE|eukprot:Cvel_4405.t1-p1 / transcript=Cvel_4405.t1 / gene=Cvel_4405 / organism=Chromera_velia_CCMP2878 / gene_product=hypothetical protein / transcript_product=hypothetical protein / location=Cvel_scaffold191:94194-98340(-) / protein_length=300 / sequence_SO=supercontig / SO=protein_coding / is_pseudo=false
MKCSICQHIAHELKRDVAFLVEHHLFWDEETTETRVAYSCLDPTIPLNQARAVCMHLMREAGYRIISEMRKRFLPDSEEYEETLVPLELCETLGACKEAHRSEKSDVILLEVDELGRLDMATLDRLAMDSAASLPSSSRREGKGKGGTGKGNSRGKAAGAEIQVPAQEGTRKKVTSSSSSSSSSSSLKGELSRSGGGATETEDLQEISIVHTDPKAVGGAGRGGGYPSFMLLQGQGGGDGEGGLGFPNVLEHGGDSAGADSRHQQQFSDEGGGLTFELHPGDSEIIFGDDLGSDFLPTYI